MEAVRTSETSVDNHSTRQYNPEDSSEHHTRRRENLKSHTINKNVMSRDKRSQSVPGLEVDIQKSCAGALLKSETRL
jgi:hypothetical protein